MSPTSGYTNAEIDTIARYLAEEAERGAISKEISFLLRQRLDTRREDNAVEVTTSYAK